MRLVAALCWLSACSFAPRATASIDASGTTDATRDGHLVDARLDAPPDAPPTWKTIDTLTVACVNVAVSSTVVLQTTVMYRLHATGECIVNTSNSSRSDAEYFGYNVGPTYDTFSGVDNGIAIDDLTVGATKLPAWGAYAADHTYDVPWTGTGAKISASYHDSNDSNNSGSLTLEILAYE